MNLLANRGRSYPPHPRNTASLETLITYRLGGAGLEAKGISSGLELRHLKPNSLPFLSRTLAQLNTARIYMGKVSGDSGQPIPSPLTAQPLGPRLGSSLGRKSFFFFSLFCHQQSVYKMQFNTNKQMHLNKINFYVFNSTKKTK